MGMERPALGSKLVAMGLRASCASRAMRPLWPGIPRQGGPMGSSGAGGEAGASPSSHDRHPSPPTRSARASLLFGPASSMLGASGMGEPLDGLAAEAGESLPPRPRGAPASASLLDGCPLVSPRPSWPSGSEHIVPASTSRSPDPLDEARCGWGWSGPLSAWSEVAWTSKVLRFESDAPLMAWHPAPRWPDGVEWGRRRGGSVPIEPRPASIATSSPTEVLAALWPRLRPASSRLGAGGDGRGWVSCSTASPAKTERCQRWP